ncbi:very-long-chain (3R)-3-hydroxyacyl-CoA dehydratase 2 isoform X1 [Panicum miliaceum]|uniref:Very-long-chain (3R)-3-hydroxyacyl-CoA dehydratase n=1 Tax=Panicum miliaceum TaxID=4540 RepID=A0A3L6RBC4_PANMI|nr:very-long-chain (3R)-3-hydroxyacyl-CoA dehydratase 2 isoform X1 [Panicum miliaceum]
MARPAKLYLVCYNSLQALGWFVALLRLLPCLAPPVSVHSAYAVAGDLICVLQTCAILETVHAAIGLVPTAPLLAFLQWGGRTHFVLAVVRQIPEVQSSPSVLITFMAWSISEVIRYSHYALTTLKVCPSWLTYLRYTAFIPLYPIGVGPGEMWTMYQALPFVKKRNLYSGFFKKFSMSYHSFLVGVLVCYPFLWLKLYMHVFKQRKSKLGKGSRKKRA